MPQTNHGSIEFLKFSNPQYPGDDTKLIKKWLRDSWARRKLAALTTVVNAFNALDGVHQMTLSNTTTSSTFAYWKSARTVTVQFDVWMSATGSEKQIGTLPEGFRPPQNMFTVIPIWGNGTQQTQYLRINSDGSVSIYASSTSSRLMMVLSYAV